MSIALFLAINTQSVFWLPLIAFCSFSALFYLSYRSESASRTRSSGSTKRNTKVLNSSANQITAFRFLLSAMTALLVFQLSEIVSFCLFGFAILLDGLDGYLARKHKEASEIGSLFDKTVDAYFVLLLSYILVIKYEVPFWFLGIGYLHYGYELLILGLGWQNLSIPKNPVGKYAAAFLFISLLSPFLLQESLYLSIIYLAAILVSCSFGVSFFYKFRAASVKG